MALTNAQLEARIIALEKRIKKLEDKVALNAQLDGSPFTNP